MTALTNPQKKLAMLLGASAVAVLYIMAARRLPIGALNDDAANILLARSLRQGEFSFPGGLGAPEEFLPAFPLLLLLPVWLMEPHWELLRVLPLLACAAAIALSWKLARRFLSPEGAAAATLLTALNPVFIGLGGLVMPDIAFLALTLWLFDRLEEPLNPGAILGLAAGAAAASLLRPYGALLIASLTLAIAWKAGPKRAALFALLSVLPIAAWSLRNRLIPHASQDYIGLWRGRIAAMGEPGVQAAQARKILALLFGDGLLALGGAPSVLRWPAGAAALLAAGAGVFRSLRRRQSPAIFAMAAYAIMACALNMTWFKVQTRYVIPLVPLLWLFIIAALESFFKRPKRALLLMAALFGLLSLRLDLAYARAGSAYRTVFEPKTMAWLGENTPPEARIESVKNYAVALLAGRRASALAIHLQSPEDWYEHARREGIDYLQLIGAAPDDEFFLPDLPQTLQPSLARWAMSSPRAALVFRDEGEATAVFRIARKP